MYKKIKKITNDVLYVSKLTKVENKKTIIFFIVLMSQVIALFDILIIILFTNLITGVSEELKFLKAFDFIFNMKAFLPSLIILRYYLQYKQNYSLKDLQLRIGNSLKSYIFSDIFKSKNFSVADSFFYLNTLAGHVSFFYASITSFLNYLLQTIAFSIYLFLTKPDTIAVFLTAIVLLLYPTYQFINKAREAMHASYELSKSSNYDIQRVVENLLLIKLLKKQDNELDRFNKRITKQKDYLLKNHQFGILNSYVPSFITILILSITVIFFNAIFDISLDFIAITLRLFQTLGLLANAGGMVANSHVHLDKFYEMQNTQLNEKIDLIYAPNSLDNDVAFQLSDVSFKYSNSNKFIFKNLNLKIYKNQHTVIVGPNGSGKSTFLGLISGIYSPNSGNIKVSSEIFGYVGPVPLVFTSSLRDNLVYGVENKVDDEELLRMIEEFNLFSENLQVDILNKSVDNKSLSSGQMQKIAFIRALLKKPEILLLDESTSNLDLLTKNLIFEILQNQNLTIINSTHDPDSFENVDSKLSIIINDEFNTINYQD